MSLNPTTASAWVNVIAVMINLGIATEQQIANLIASQAGPSDTDPSVMAEVAAMKLALRLQLAELRAKAKAEADRTTP